MKAGIDIPHVPYKGTVPATADAIGGNVSMVIANARLALPHIRSGRLRGIANTTAQRSALALAPELPTVVESGIRDFESVTWYGLLAPAGIRLE